MGAPLSPGSARRESRIETSVLEARASTGETAAVGRRQGLSTGVRSAGPESPSAATSARFASAELAGGVARVRALAVAPSEPCSPGWSCSRSSPAFASREAPPSPPAFLPLSSGPLASSFEPLASSFERSPLPFPSSSRSALPALSLRLSVLALPCSSSSRSALPCVVVALSSALALPCVVVVAVGACRRCRCACRGCRRCRVRRRCGRPCRRCRCACSALALPCSSSFRSGLSVLGVAPAVVAVVVILRRAVLRRAWWAPVLVLVASPHRGRRVVTPGVPVCLQGRRAADRSRAPRRPRRPAPSTRCCRCSRCGRRPRRGGGRACRSGFRFRSPHRLRPVGVVVASVVPGARGPPVVARRAGVGIRALRRATGRRRVRLTRCRRCGCRYVHRCGHRRRQRRRDRLRRRVRTRRRQVRRLRGGLLAVRERRELSDEARAHARGPARRGRGSRVRQPRVPRAPRAWRPHARRDRAAGTSRWSSRARRRRSSAPRPSARPLEPAAATAPLPAPSAATRPPPPQPPPPPPPSRAFSSAAAARRRERRRERAEIGAARADRLRGNPAQRLAGPEVRAHLARAQQPPVALGDQPPDLCARHLAPLLELHQHHACLIDRLPRGLLGRRDRRGDVRVGQVVELAQQQRPALSIRAAARDRRAAGCIRSDASTRSSGPGEPLASSGCPSIESSGRRRRSSEIASLCAMR